MYLNTEETPQQRKITAISSHGEITEELESPASTYHLIPREENNHW